MKIKDFRTFENELQDEILDKMSIEAIPFDRLSKYDQYTLRTGKKHPEEIEKEDVESRTYGKGDLKFIYEEHDITYQGQSPYVEEDDTPQNPHIVIKGIVVFKGEEYKGVFELSHNMSKVEFFDKKGKEFDPRGTIYENVLVRLFQHVIEDKIKNDLGI